MKELIECKVKVNNFFEPAEAAQLVHEASKFSSRISLMAEDKTANAKSIMGIISLDLQGGQTVRIVADGDDEKNALPVVENFLTKTAASA
jgi:phosphotransferase system HPr (HPr) family protein